MPEVYQVTDGLLGDAHVVDELRLVFGHKLGYGLQLHQQATEHKKIWNVPLFQWPAFVDAFEPLILANLPLIRTRKDKKTQG